MSLQVNFYENVEDKLLKFAVIISKHKEKWDISVDSAVVNKRTFETNGEI